MNDLIARLTPLTDARDCLAALLDAVPIDHIVFTSSLGLEDQVITDLLWGQGHPVDIVVLDTGRLHPETYAVMSHTQTHYQRHHRVMMPNPDEVEALVNTHGINCFYDTVALRQQCCAIRKTHPLQRALAGKTAWVTGIRREQSPYRATMPRAEWDDAHGLIKVNPLLDWSLANVWDYVKSHGIPINGLHEKGYPSIGCAPCTRAVQAGQDSRSGRWWWESREAGHSECGLHRPSSPA